MRQIVQGAPFEIFLSADESYVHRLAEQSLTRGEGEVYAVGRIVMYTPRGSGIQPAPDLSTLARAMRDGELNRLAIANPEHAPYGTIAKQALINAGLWTSVVPYLVLGESAAQAAQFGRSGSVDAAIIPLPLALNQTVSRSGRFELISESLYSPLQQRLVMLRDAGPAAEAFVEFMGEPVAQEILDRFGFGQAALGRNRGFPGN
jgi:molybdate transport system substrate-binding protein